jgi:hypothetical protein
MWLGVNLRARPKVHVFKRHWTRCSNCYNHFKLSSQHDSGIYMIKRIFTFDNEQDILTSDWHNLDLFISHTNHTFHTLVKWVQRGNCFIKAHLDYLITSKRNYMSINIGWLWASSHIRLDARDHCTSSTLIGGKGRVGPSSLHTMLDGPTK